jgi:carbamoyl-phosphate synthase large subunit
MCKRGLALSPTHELLIEESLLGWKEFEMEVVRDRKDNCIIVCSIENLDPMGCTPATRSRVAPAQTLTDKEYQIMRDASIAGVARGRRRHWRIERPVRDRSARRPDDRHRDESARVALSRARVEGDGLPIAKVAAKLAVGYTLDELRNEITGGATRLRSSRRSTTSSPRCRGSRSRSSRKRTTGSRRR